MAEGTWEICVLLPETTYSEASAKVERVWEIISTLSRMGHVQSLWHEEKDAEDIAVSP